MERLGLLIIEPIFLMGLPPKLRIQYSTQDSEHRTWYAKDASGEESYNKQDRPNLEHSATYVFHRSSLSPFEWSASITR
jgi:hypothetical protein